MSDMELHRGIIKRLSTKENAKEIFDQLVEKGEFDPKWCEFTDDEIRYIDSDKYAVVNGCIFDISGAPTEYDYENDANEAVRLNETDYRIHTYFYNGGASFDEMLDESIPKADKEYKKSEWRDSANIIIRVKLVHYQDSSKTYVYEGPVDQLLYEDDGGMTGLAAVQSMAAQNPDGSGGDWESWCIEEVEYRDAGEKS